MIRRLDRYLSVVETTLIVSLTLAGLSMAFLQVVLRYVFNTGIHWLGAGMTTALIWAMLLGAVRGVREGTHPRVDLLVALVPARVRAALNCLAFVATLALVCFYLKDSLFYASFLNKINAVHPELGIRQVYPFLIVPIITALMALRYGLLAITLWRKPDTLTPEEEFRAGVSDEPANGRAPE